MNLEKHIETISGTVARIIYRNNDTGYTVFCIDLGLKKEAIARGSAPLVQAGEEVVLSGFWVSDPKFGKQFELNRCAAKQPTTLIGLKKYLSSGLIKGIGPVYAEKMVNYFGEQVLEVIDKEPQRLKEVPGIGQKRAETIMHAWVDQREIAHIMVFLQEKEISPSYAVKIYKTYGNRSIDIIIENPYRLCEDVWGIGFKMADQIAQKIGISQESVKRVRSGVLHVLSTDSGYGNLYIELESLKTKTAALLELEQSIFQVRVKMALHELHQDDKIKVVTDSNNNHFIALTKQYRTEKAVSTIIKKHLKIGSLLALDTESIYQIMRAETSLNDDQQRAVMTCLQEKITIITGGPGTGKTTIIKQLLTILERHKLQYKLAAPTGRAAMRISESTHRPASTIHRLLEFDPHKMGFSRNEQNSLETDFLIVDEASMIDIFLAHALLKATPSTAHIIFIGDSNQLPSVGPGNFLHDIIASQVIPVIRLTHIFRQAQDSLIIINAHRVNNGDLPIYDALDAKHDFIFIKEQDQTAIKAHLKKIFTSLLPRWNISLDETMVLTPMHRGISGTYQLNQDIQELIKPVKQERGVNHGGFFYSIGDRVMQIKNNYDKIVFNGDIGYIEEINTVDQNLTVRYIERVITYEFSELDELTLAYAISIHKSQGSEYQAVIIPLFMSHFTLLQRNLFYTGIMRAKRVCILIGQPQAIAYAIKNNTGIKRITFLKEYLTCDLTCR